MNCADPMTALNFELWSKVLHSPIFAVVQLYNTLSLLTSSQAWHSLIPPTPESHLKNLHAKMPTCLESYTAIEYCSDSGEYIYNITHKPAPWHYHVAHRDG
jgi:hypothetical protein